MALTPCCLTMSKWHVDRNFYTFVLTYRGAYTIDTPEAQFAEAVFEDDSFPRAVNDYDTLSRYVEEHFDERLSASTFDTLYDAYDERYGN